MKLTTLKDNIAVVRLKSKLESESGIIIESTRSIGADKAKVISVGPLVDEVKVGDTILIDWSKVRQMMVENNPVFVLSQKDVTAVFED
jgi:co-chaperonin GroES (HSP10)